MEARMGEGGVKGILSRKETVPQRLKPRLFWGDNGRPEESACKLCTSTPELGKPVPFNNPSAFNAQFASASRLALAQSLSGGTAFIGGPPAVPQEHGPSVFASVMQEQDLSLRHAHT